MDSQIQDSAPQGASSAQEPQIQQVAQPAPEASGGSPALAAPIAAGQAPEATPYQPNFKFKVQDEEKEIDEWVRSAIKDAETEKKARDLWERAHGLDIIKPKLQKAREELERVTGDYGGIQEGIAQLREHVKNEDFGSFFKALNIPKDMIYQWVAKDLQYKNLAPEEKQRYDELMELRRERSELQKQRDTYQGQSREVQLQAMEMELDQALQTPDANQVMRDFDARQGRVGAFREQVIRQLAAIQLTTGKRPSAADGVQSLLGLMGRAPGQATTLSPQGNPQPTTQLDTAPQAEPTKPVIPNLKSRASVSPVKKQPANMQEFRDGIAKRLKELGA